MRSVFSYITEFVANNFLTIILVAIAVFVIERYYGNNQEKFLSEFDRLAILWPDGIPDEITRVLLTIKNRLFSTLRRWKRRIKRLIQSATDSRY